jgi:AcrR family transcriptional regulator
VDTPPATDRAGLRRDAEINRQRVLAAAKELFRERGTEVTLNDIAAHAGVGVATVYRRFANKEELIDALFDDIIEQAAALAVEAAADADAWHGLISSLEKVCEIQAFDRGLRQVMFASERKAHTDKPRSANESPQQSTNSWPAPKNKGRCDATSSASTSR